jgi:hypothetical protein
MDPLEHLPVQNWVGPFSPEISGLCVNALEDGKILFAPALSFELLPAEQRFLSPRLLSGKSKNISFNAATKSLGGTNCAGQDREELTTMLRRFSEQAVALIRALCPHYDRQSALGLTSFRPAEVSGRSASWRKDDTRLHVDAFPSRPSNGKRILRLFANVNKSTPRVWRAGEPFENAARKLLPRVRAPLPGSLSVMAALRITKGRRSLYDHYMLGLHDAMKADTQYQAESPQARIEFAPGAVWACFTDSVSHAAMSGQYAFEQTFYLPVNAMADPARAPLRILETILSRTLT